ncbi:MULTISPECIES: GerMN domain-containing protein [unclassified Micromonospora]|uniref:GerMN domain-containing protein n=1 Tax=unclassified Micromonospora TaxID=2617518 RepID=UPI0033D4F0C1
MSRASRALLLVVVLLAGCGVPIDESPRPVQAPRGRLPAPVTGTPTGSVGRVDETLCFVRDDRLYPMVRRIDALPPVDVHLQHLLAGPSSTERDSGVTSALPGTVVVAGARVNGRLVEVDIQEAVDETGRSDEILAFGQIVCTLTRRQDVDGVSFQRAGRPLDVPRADGSLSRQPLTAADYLPLTRQR